MRDNQIDLNELRAQGEENSNGEVNARAESAFYDHKARLEKESLQRLIFENSARKNFSRAIFWITVIWMLLILSIVVLSGFKIVALSDGVLIALITTTTANVFGFLYVVVNYLFNKDRST